VAGYDPRNCRVDPCGKQSSKIGILKKGYRDTTLTGQGNELGYCEKHIDEKVYLFEKGSVRNAFETEEDFWREFES
jgi:hypothetical protein